MQTINTLKKDSNFRRWLQRQWQDHIRELELWNQGLPQYTMADYFRKYRWWLRREYKYQNQ